MSHMLGVPALEVGDPVVLRILMEADDTSRYTSLLLTHSSLAPSTLRSEMITSADSPAAFHSDFIALPTSVALSIGATATIVEPDPLSVAPNAPAFTAPATIAA